MLPLKEQWCYKKQWVDTAGKNRAKTKDNSFACLVQGFAVVTVSQVLMKIPALGILIWLFL